MHIAFISNENPYDKSNGGIGTYCKYMIKMMADSRNRISFITIGSDKDRENIYQILDEWCKVIIYPIKYRKSSADFPMDLAEMFYQKIKNVHNIDRIDIIECQDWLGVGYKIAQNMDIPFITRLHTPLFLIEKIANNQKIYRHSERIKECEKLQMKNSTALSSPCKELADIIQNEVGIKVDILPNPIDIREFNYEIKFSSPKLVENRKYFLYLGRLEYRKGVLVLAEIIDEILSKYPDYIIVMCGKDTIYKKRSVKSLIKEKFVQFENSVYFIENVSGDEKKAYIQNAELILQPSLWENFSYVTLEAMASAKGVICTRCGGFKEIIDENIDGFLVEPNSARSLMNTIDLALKSNQNRIGERARKKIEEKYDIYILKSDFEKYYESVMCTYYKKI